jgi:hypothetical protein
MDGNPGLAAIHKLKQSMIDQPLTLTLNANHLVFTNGSKWISGVYSQIHILFIYLLLYSFIESNDYINAQNTISELSTENKVLKEQLIKAIEQLETASRDIIDLKQIKIAAMDMVRMSLNTTIFTCIIFSLFRFSNFTFLACRSEN